MDCPMRGFDCERTIGHLVKGRRKRASKLAFGKCELDLVRQWSAEICLRKALPDLSQTEVEADIATYVARLPAPAVNVTEWNKSLDEGKCVQHDENKRVETST